MYFACISCLPPPLRPVRMHMDIDSNMEMVGKRFPYYTEYQVWPQLAAPQYTTAVSVSIVCSFITCLCVRARAHVHEVEGMKSHKPAPMLCVYYYCTIAKKTYTMRKTVYHVCVNVPISSGWL